MSVITSIGYAILSKLYPKKFPPKHYVRIVMAFPNKELEFLKVEVKESKFDYRDRTYIIDASSVYFYKDKAHLFYVFDGTSPLRFNNDRLDPSMKSDEVNKFFESKAIQELLSGADSLLVWTVILAGIAALISLLCLLILTGAWKTGLWDPIQEMIKTLAAMTVKTVTKT